MAYFIYCTVFISHYFILHSFYIALFTFFSFWTFSCPPKNKKKIKKLSKRSFILQIWMCKSTQLILRSFILQIWMCKFAQLCHLISFWSDYQQNTRVFSSSRPFSNTSCIQLLLKGIFPLFRMWFFEAPHGWVGARKAPALSLPNICHIYSAMMKPGTVITYLTKIQKLYESRHTPLELCWHQHFFTGNQKI